MDVKKMGKRVLVLALLAGWVVVAVRGCGKKGADTKFIPDPDAARKEALIDSLKWALVVEDEKHKADVDSVNKKCKDQIQDITNEYQKALDDCNESKKSADKKPVAKKPVAKKPVAKKPVAKKPVAKAPVTKVPLDSVVVVEPRRAPAPEKLDAPVYVYDPETGKSYPIQTEPVKSAPVCPRQQGTPVIIKDDAHNNTVNINNGVINNHYYGTAPVTQQPVAQQPVEQPVARPVVKPEVKEVPQQNNPQSNQDCDGFTVQTHTRIIIINGNSCRKR